MRKGEKKGRKEERGRDETFVFMSSRTRALEMLSSARVQKQPFQKQREKKPRLDFLTYFL